MLIGGSQTGPVMPTYICLAGPLENTLLEVSPRTHNIWHGKIVVVNVSLAKSWLMLSMYNVILSSLMHRQIKATQKRLADSELLGSLDNLVSAISITIDARIHAISIMHGTNPDTPLFNSVREL